MASQFHQTLLPSSEDKFLLEHAFVVVLWDQIIQKETDIELHSKQKYKLFYETKIYR